MPTNSVLPIRQMLSNFPHGKLMAKRIDAVELNAPTRRGDCMIPQRAPHPFFMVFLCLKCGAGRPSSKTGTFMYNHHPVEPARQAATLVKAGNLVNQPNPLQPVLLAEY